MSEMPHVMYDRTEAARLCMPGVPILDLVAPETAHASRASVRDISEIQSDLAHASDLPAQIVPWGVSWSCSHISRTCKTCRLRKFNSRRQCTEREGKRERPCPGIGRPVHQATIQHAGSDATRAGRAPLAFTDRGDVQLAGSAEHAAAPVCVLCSRGMPCGCGLHRPLYMPGRMSATTVPPLFTKSRMTFADLSLRASH